MTTHFCIRLDKTLSSGIHGLPLDLRRERKDKEAIYRTGNAYDLQNYGRIIFKEFTSNSKSVVKSDIFFLAYKIS